MNYYNDNDPKICEWLRALVRAGLIPLGDVDDRSIADVQATDLTGYTQCHFFAGIGGWSRALELAGWPATRPIWTGSCPCQPFSAAGKRRGVDDERHLWPEFARLIAECSPPIVFGEQVASADGRRWLSGVRLDLEALGYGVGAADLCAAGVAAPHLRQRLYWVADHQGGGGLRSKRDGPISSGARTGGVGYPQRGGCEGGDVRGPGAEITRAGRLSDFWDDSIIIPCRDPRKGIVYRRASAESEAFPLAARLPGRVVQLCGLGNSICPPLAAEFIAGCTAAQGRES